MKNITKIIGTALLAGTLLFGCSGKAPQSESKLEQAVKTNQVVQTISQENEKYDTQVNDYVAPTNVSSQPEKSIDNVVENNYESEKVTDSEEIFDLYKELAKKNTSLKMDQKYLKESDKGVEVGYDIISKDGKDYFVDYTLFDFNKDGEPEPATTYQAEIRSYETDGNKTIINILLDNSNSKIIITHNDKDNITVQNEKFDFKGYDVYMSDSPIKNLKDILTYFMSGDNIPKVIDKNNKTYDPPYIIVDPNN